jgi:glucose-6-phosphate dehydrogenase assembly protein OpcA
MNAALQPEQILRELDELWVSLGKQENGEGSGGVLRACAMTLITVTEESQDAASLGETLAMLMREHPSRAIVLRLLDTSEPVLESRVVAQCWMPFGQRQQICCEQIEISTSASRLPDLPPVIRALTAPDLPVVVWCRQHDLLANRELAPILDLANKLIVNSAGADDPAAFLKMIRAAASENRLIADLSWTRLTRWRDTIAQIFENPAYLSRLPEVSEVAVAYYGDHVPARALYLAAWLRSVIGGKAKYRFDPASGRAPCQPQAEVQAVRLLGVSLDVSIELIEGSVVELRTDSLVKRTVFPVLNDHELMREELSLLGRDSVYDKVLGLAMMLAPG